MLLSRIGVDPARYQKRDRPFSERTVAGILADGIDVARFDPVPLVPTSRGRFVVGGDGHSRYHGVQLLAAEGRLPKPWRRGKDWDVPHRVVDDDQAKRLAWTANMIHHTFSPAEEAKVFQEMIDAGHTLADVAKLTGRSETDVTRALPLNKLCRDIRDVVGASPAAGGIDVLTAQVLAAGFERHNVTPAQQRDLWHRALKHAMLNFQSARRFIESIGPHLAERSKDLLFELPANAEVVLSEAKARSAAFRSGKMGLALLLKARDAGGLAGYPELVKWLDAHGERAVAELSTRVTEDADLLASIVLPGTKRKRRPV